MSLWVSSEDVMPVLCLLWEYCCALLSFSVTSCWPSNNSSNLSSSTSLSAIHCTPPAYFLSIPVLEWFHSFSFSLAFIVISYPIASLPFSFPFPCLFYPVLSYPKCFYIYSNFFAYPILSYLILSFVSLPFSLLILSVHIFLHPFFLCLFYLILSFAVASLLFLCIPFSSSLLFLFCRLGSYFWNQLAGGLPKWLVD